MMKAEFTTKQESQEKGAQKQLRVLVLVNGLNDGEMLKQRIRRKKIKRNCLCYHFRKNVINVCGSFTCNEKSYGRFFKFSESQIENIRAETGESVSKQVDRLNYPLQFR